MIVASRVSTTKAEDLAANQDTRMASSMSRCCWCRATRLVVVAEAAVGPAAKSAQALELGSQPAGSALVPARQAAVVEVARIAQGGLVCRPVGR